MAQKRNTSLEQVKSLLLERREFSAPNHVGQGHPHSDLQQDKTQTVVVELGQVTVFAPRILRMLVQKTFAGMPWPVGVCGRLVGSTATEVDDEWFLERLDPTEILLARFEFIVEKYDVVGGEVFMEPVNGMELQQRRCQVLGESLSIF